MGKKLYVGNLTYSVDSSELEQLFSPHGQVVSAQIITDRDTGQSKGFGFVEMADDNEAQAAIEALNGKDHGGRALTVNEARPREERPRFGGGGGGGATAAAVDAAAAETAATATDPEPPHVNSTEEISFRGAVVFPRVRSMVSYPVVSL